MQATSMTLKTHNLTRCFHVFWATCGLCGCRQSLVAWGPAVTSEANGQIIDMPVTLMQQAAVVIVHDDEDYSKQLAERIEALLHGAPYNLPADEVTQLVLPPSGPAAAAVMHELKQCRVSVSYRVTCLCGVPNLPDHMHWPWWWPLSAA